MARWRSAYGAPAELRVAGGEVVLTRGGEERRCTSAAFTDGALHPEVLEALGLKVLVEAEAAAKVGDLAVRAALALPPIYDRPGVQRTWDFDRKSFAWLQGRTLALSLPGRDRLELPFAEVAARGLPAEVRAALGEAPSAQLEEAVRKLEPLPCFCGTSFERLDQHDALEVLSSDYDPRAPVDVNARVGRCQVCGRVWTLEESGDSHYSYCYTVSPFAPGD